jgi:hypothetical protein
LRLPQKPHTAVEQIGGTVFAVFSVGILLKESIMSIKPLPLFLAFALLLTQMPVAFGQQSVSNDWSAVQQIKTNAKLVVKQKNGKEIKGLMIEANDTTLTIDRNGKPLSIARNDVREVSISSGKAEKGKWSGIGAAIGAGTGAGIGATKYRSDRDDYGIYPVMGLLIGTGVGAVTGLVFGQSRRKRELVYSAQ